MSRLTGFLALMVLTGVVGCGQEGPSNPRPPILEGPKSADYQPSVQADVQKALEVGNEDPGQAITILEKALKSSPEDRQALLLLGVIATGKAARETDKAARISLFHKAFAAMTKLKATYKDLSSNEKNFQFPIELGEARALALEGKSKESFDLVKALIASGNGDPDVIESEADLKSLRALPEFTAFLDSIYQPKLAEAKKEVEAELAASKPFPFDFKLKGLDDKVVTLGDFRGKLTIVDLWGTWCPPCRKEIPHFVALSKKYADKGLAIVGINCNEEGSEAEIKKTIRDFAQAQGIEYPCVINEDSTALQSQIPGFQGYPTTVFVDASGKVRLVFPKAESKEKLEAAILTLLGEGTKAP